VGNCDNPYLVPKKEEKSGTATRSLRSPRREVDRTRFELIIKSSFGHDLPFFFDFSISGIKRVKAQWVSPSVQLNLNHCARFAFLSRAIGEIDGPSFSSPPRQCGPCVHPSGNALPFLLLVPVSLFFTHGTTLLNPIFWPGSSTNQVRVLKIHG